MNATKQEAVDVTFVKVVAGLYEIRDGAGEVVGRTATHPRVFPRQWWATVGDVTGYGKTRGDAVASAFRRLDR